MNPKLKLNLFINGEPAPQDLIDKGLFETHIKVGNTYKTGQSTVQVVKKIWEEVVPGVEYNVQLQNIAVEELPGSARASIPATEVVENLATGEIVRQGGTAFTVSHIHWWLKPSSSDAEVSVYADPLVIVAKA